MLAAVRGAGLVVTVVPELAPLLLGDLGRIGAVVSTWPGSAVGFRVREEDAELLRCLAEGHSVTEAARFLNVSRRMPTGGSSGAAQLTAHHGRGRGEFVSSSLERRRSGATACRKAWVGARAVAFALVGHTWEGR